MLSMTKYYESVPDKARKWKWVLWAFFIAVTVFSFMGINNLKFLLTIDGWFSEDDPAIVALDGFHSRFGGEDHLLIVYKPKDGNVFSEKSLKVARGIRNDLLKLQRELGPDSTMSRIVKITGIPNAPVMIAEDDALLTRKLVGRKIPNTKEQMDELIRIAEFQKSFPLQYFSYDHQYGGIMVETDFGAVPVEKEAVLDEGGEEMGEFDVNDIVLDVDTSAVKERDHFEPVDMAEYLDLMLLVEQVLDKPEYAEHFEYYPVGNTAMGEYNKKMLEEMGSLYMAMLLIILVVLWFLFRSLAGVIWPILIVILSCIWTVGISGWMGLTVTGHLILTVVMILVVGVADTIHVLSGYVYYREREQSHVESLRAAFRKSGTACLLTTLTTVIGMCAIMITDIVPIRVFGFMTALGISTAFLLTIYWFPLMLDLWSPVKSKSTQGDLKDKNSGVFNRIVPKFNRLLHRYLDSVLPFVNHYRTTVVSVFMVVFVVCIYGALQVKVDSDAMTLYPKDSQIRKNFEIADTKMTGTQLMEIYLNLDREYAFQDPYVLNVMDDLQKLIETKYDKYVVRSLSMMDLTKKAYQTLHEDREDKYLIPDDPKVLSQTLFMFDNSNPSDRRRMVSDDYSKSHISVYLRNAGSYEYNQVFADMQADIDVAMEKLRDKYPNAQMEVTGTFSLMMKGSDYLSWSALKSFGLVIVIISLILLVVFGSLKVGLISILPNLIPATLTFGLMGLLGVPLDFTTVAIAPVIVGIAVDDTIHFLTHYRHEVSVHKDIQKALKATISEVGQAVTFTTLILGLGLSVLSFSTNVGNANVGIYGSLAVVIAWFCDIYLLPALITLFKIDFEQVNNKSAEAEA